MNRDVLSKFEKKVAILDPASGTANLGDQIISEAVKDIVMDASNGNARLLKISVHQKPSKAQLSIIDDADIVIAGGSNLINFRYWPLRDGRWNNSLNSLLNLKNVVFLGVGATSDEDRSNFLGRYLYKNIISRDYIHSARDEFTAKMMLSYGFTNVLNTTCPTMWALNYSHMRDIPSKKTNSVVFTLTDYHRDHEADSKMIQTLIKSYKNIYFWPQGYYDLDYFNSIGSFSEVIRVPSNISSFNDILTNIDIDYVGTRLHAGIRALQKKRRSIIICIDNRAREIARDTGLFIIERRGSIDLKEVIYQEVSQNIKLPLENIHLWKTQLEEILRA